jgi:hypothetical protein
MARAGRYGDLVYGLLEAVAPPGRMRYLVI